MWHKINWMGYLGIGIILIAFMACSSNEDPEGEDLNAHYSLLVGTWNGNLDYTNTRVKRFTLNADGTGTYTSLQDTYGKLTWSATQNQLQLNFDNAKSDIINYYISGVTIYMDDNESYSLDSLLSGYWYSAEEGINGYSYLFGKSGMGKYMYFDKEGLLKEEEFQWKIDNESSIAIKIGNSTFKLPYIFTDGSRLNISASEGYPYGVGNFGKTNSLDVYGDWKAIYTETGDLRDGEERSGEIDITNDLYWYSTICDGKKISRYYRLLLIKDFRFYLTDDDGKDAVFDSRLRYKYDQKKVYLEIAGEENNFIQYVGYEKIDK